ncbi:hypothetical protein AB0J86_35515 [Micromonospora sp. NPDC049559]|uniref:hypothetical protein n=1 Tax=Micromonospora sp. NPDC049559 TaxID=3155923 RepID=UPI003449AEAD
MNGVRQESRTRRGHGGRDPGRTGGLRRGAAALAAVLVAALVAVVPVLGPQRAASAEEEPPSRKCTELTCTFDLENGDGNKLYGAQVTVSQTTNLVNRQKIALSWSNFHPSHNGLVLPGQSGQDNYLEYPVVVLQCRGSDPTISTCYQNRYGWDGPYRPQDDALDGATDGLLPNREGNRDTVWSVPFQAANRTAPYLFDAGPLVDGSTEFPPDFGTENFPGNELIEYTTLDGTSRQGVEFEARDEQTYPSLGCSDRVACALVVIPILDPECTAEAAPACTAGPNNAAGSDGTYNSGNPYLIGRGNWARASNWRNRFVFPLSFAPRADTCAATDPRPRRAVYGSEPADLAMRQWAGKFCTDPGMPKLGHTRQPESVARIAIRSRSATGYAADAVLTTQPVPPGDESARPVAHAPVAATGFAVSFLIDHNGQKVALPTLRLTPRLLAKLLTQSYPTVNFRDVGQNQGHPTIGGNPFSVFVDQDFKEANPEIAAMPGNNNLINLESPFVVTNDSDAYWELTRYIAADPEAVEWLSGKPDPWGMVVNPLWRNKPFPASRSELRDQEIKKDLRTECDTASPVAYLTQIANGFSGLDDASLALSEGRPARSSCSFDVGSQTWSFKRVAPSFFPNRKFLAVTTVSYARAYGLPMAELQTPFRAADGARSFVAPTDAGLLRSLGYTRLDEKTGTLSVDHQALPKTAYPGSFLVYAAAATAGVEKRAAGDYAKFVRYAATDGQTRGTAVGQLPNGYVPLPDPLRQQATTAADAVEAQAGQVPLPPPDLPDRVRDDVENDLGNNGGGGSGSGSTPSPGASPSVAGGTPSPGASRPATLASTRAENSALGRWILPVVLILGLLAAAGAPVVLMAGQPGHPVRRFLYRIPGPTRRWFTDGR